MAGYTKNKTTNKLMNNEQKDLNATTNRMGKLHKHIILIQ